MKIIGLFLVIVFTVGGLMVAAGVDKAIALLLHSILPASPGEIIIIMGCAVAAFMIANSPETIKGTMKYFSCLTKPSAYSKEDYIELMSALYVVFKLARTKGWLALENHIENPEESDLFGEYKGFQQNHHAIEFFCDYLRIISLGTDNPHELEALMDEELKTIEHHESHPGHAMQEMADGIPALGIVAAVLGIIKTMGSISEPPEILGKMIGGALVGTFLGVWISYAFVAPIASAMKGKAETEVMFYRAMKVAIIAFLNGAAPQVAVEFTRKFLPHDVRPGFIELEEILNEIPAPTA